MNEFDETKIVRDDGGKFADKPHEVAPANVVSLTNEKDYSFDNPPFPANGDDVIQFWSTVEVPDDAAMSVRRGYQRVSDVHIRRKHDRWRRTFCADTRVNEWDPVLRETSGAMIRRFQQEHEMWKPSDTKAIIRAAQMYRDAENLPGDECARVRRTPIKLPSGEVTTPEETYQRYLFYETERYIYDRNPNVDAFEAMEEVQREMLELTADIRAATDETNSAIRDDIYGDH